MGIALAAISDGTTRLLPASHAGIASGILTTAQQIGNSTGLATTTVLDGRHPTAWHGTGFAYAAGLSLLALVVITAHVHVGRQPARTTQEASPDVHLT